MKSGLKVTILVAFSLVIIFGISVYISKSYYPSLPFEGLSKREALKKIESNDNAELIKLTEGATFEWYAYKGNQQDGSKQIIKKMEQRGFVFREQLGAGYIFRDKDNEVKKDKIIESQMWTSKYVLYEVPKTLDDDK
ncbi:hypothetical protein KZ483_26860 [Paenibacillus sp. sptzw28]|uniref:hypothetical protein n=1 Tax=Paenibacillus sp. sptzw28 TaxID=715179 RepID=UPI001C6DDD07|nr:hypothetical protein [Paenibacillus sp. sptzw28]QYR21259.1 hypothetical protein KZ483_26860 [Paenibacillus sp. sptzw28]